MDNVGELEVQSIASRAERHTPKVLDRAHRKVKGFSVLAGKPGQQLRGRWKLQAGEEMCNGRVLGIIRGPTFNVVALEYLSSSEGHALASQWALVQMCPLGGASGALLKRLFSERFCGRMVFFGTIISQT